MRWVGIAVAVLAVGLLAVPSAMTVGTHPGPSGSPPAAVRSTLLAPPPTGKQLIEGLLQHNLSIPSAGPPPTSAYPETPAPPVPNTMPTVVRVVTNGQGCCYYVNQTPAGGPWDAVVLNYTGTVVGGVYDSSYRAYIGGAEVLYGTTPEYGTWTVLQNVTEYESLLEPGANFTFILSAAVLAGGAFDTTLTLSFYPPPGGAPVPPEPSQVVPLWTKYVQASLPVVSGVATVPADASAVSLQLWAYGMGPNNGDEFWWASTTPERAVELSVDGNPLAAVYPFPYLNTGGVDLFLWRPIQAAYTLSDRPYSVNLTGALGALDGTHTYNVTIGGRHAPDPWWTGGSLLVWTDPAVTGASLTSLGATWPSPMTVGGTVTSSTSFHFQSTLTTSAGPVNVSTTGSGSFRESQTQVTGGTNGTSWANMTQGSSLITQTTVVGPNATDYANASRAFTFGTDLGAKFVESSSTGGGYPIFGNATTYMLEFQQAWTELGSLVTLGSAGARASFSDAVDNEVTGANGIFSDAESIASATASPTFLAFTFVQSSTPKYTAEQLHGPQGSAGYSHILTGSDYRPTDPNDAETILDNRFDTVPLPLSASLRVSPDPLDVGQSITILASVTGGAGVYSYAWTNLPRGCAASSAALIACAPTSAGTFLASVAVADSSGDAVQTAPTVIVVSPALNATVGPSTPGSDVGQPLSFAAAITGGTPPYACSWTVGGIPATDPCNASVSADTSVPGSVTATVSVTDAAGEVANASSAPVPVHGPLLLVWDPANATTTVGVASTYSLTVEGGTAPFVLTWYEGSSAVSGLNGTSATIVPTAVGNLTISVGVVDASGGSASSTPLSVTVHAARSNGTGSTSNSGSVGSDTTFWLAVGLGALAGVEAIFLIARRIPPRPPSPP
jgi:hypothetical protein